MNRRVLLNKAFQRGHLLHLDSSFYRDWVNKFIIDEIKGDFGAKGDISSDPIISGKKNARALIISKSEGIVAGLEEICFLLDNYSIKFNALKKDGSRVTINSVIMELQGNAKTLLKLERSVLDILQRMSGIATTTRQLIYKVGDIIKIAPTRKTQWRYLDKKAVYLGGGLTHRLALWDSILIKDNHLSLLKKLNNKYIEYALVSAWKHKDKSNFIEIEVQNKNEALIAAKVFKSLNKGKSYPCLIMLDNIDPKNIISIVNILKKKNILDYILLEASGGINPSNIISYSKTGVDVVSLGYLTHSAKALDTTMKFYS